MNIPSIDELLDMDVSESFDSNPVPLGTYNVIITDTEVNKGPKGPYIKVETTIFDGEHERRKVWRNAVSFSEKALGMPGGVANLLQATNPNIDRDLEANELPAAIAAAVMSTAVVIEVEHEQIVRNGQKAYLPDGEPEMRATVKSWAPAGEEFLEAFENAANGVDDDLPF